jgi:hypothetical protein
MAAVHFYHPKAQMTSVWQLPARHSPVLLADEHAEQQWRQYPHLVWERHDGYWEHHRLGPKEYNGGSGTPEEYIPGSFKTPPPGWPEASPAYLEERRQVAINMQQRMLAHGDTQAVNRLGAVISQLNNQLGLR